MTKRETCFINPLKGLIYFSAFFFLFFLSCVNDKDSGRPIVPPDPNLPTTISNFYPKTGGVTSKLMVYGTNFGTDTSYIKVTVNGKNARVISSDGEAIYAIVPSRAGTGDIKVFIGKNDNIQEFTFEDDPFDYVFRENVTTVCGQVGQPGIVDDSDGEIALVRRPWCVTTDLDGNLFFVEEGRGSNQDGGLRQYLDNKVRTIVRNSGANFRSPASAAFSLDSDTLFLLQTIYPGSNDMTLSDPVVVLFLRDDGFQVPRKHVTMATEVRTAAIAVHPITGELFMGGATSGWVYKVNHKTQQAEQCITIPTNNTANRIHGVNFAFSPNGEYLYIINTYKHNIYRAKYNYDAAEPTKIFDAATLFVGSGNAGHRDGIGTIAEFNSPGQGTCDTDGNLYVADRNNHCIRKITPDGTVSTFAGQPGTSGYADGLLLESLFKYPESVHYCKASDVWYVADCDNELIRKILVE